MRYWKRFDNTIARVELWEEIVRYAPCPVETVDIIPCQMASRLTNCCLSPSMPMSPGQMHSKHSLIGA